MMPSAFSWPSVRTVVLKVGASVLTSPQGHFLPRRVEELAAAVVKELRRGRRFVIVTSGAIACGMDTLALKARPGELPQLQACAAIGQGKLMKVYEQAFARRGFHTGQLLLTRDVLDDRLRYLNVRNTLLSLLAYGAVPVVNENDSVSTEEICFGDNDRLSVLVAQLIQAHAVVNATDVDGLRGRDGSRIERVAGVEALAREKHHLAQGSSRAQTVGGIRAKLEAARMALESGIPFALIQGTDPKSLTRLLEGGPVGTLFLPRERKRVARKDWLACARTPKGALFVDAGARRALEESGRSLLASGIVSASGEFERGDCVEVIGPGDHVIGRGLTHYSRREVDRIAGKKTSEIADILGYKFYDEVVHRDNLVIVNAEPSGAQEEP